MRRSACAALAGAVLLQLGVQGCSERESDSSSRTPSRVTSTDNTAPTKPVSMRISPEGRAAARCLRRERASATETAFRLQLAVDHLMRSTSKVSGKAAVQVAARARRVRLEVASRCSQLSSGLATFLRTAETHSRSPLGHEEIDAVLSAYGEWAEQVRTPKWTRGLEEAVRGCRALKRDVSASYRVWWRWSDTGRVWWIELTFRSDNPRPLFATLSGGVMVSDLVGQSVDGAPGHRRAGLMRWGGSSADFAEIRRGIAQQLVAPGAGPYIVTGPGGRFDVQRVDVSVDVPGVRSWWCSLPVPARS